MRIRTLEQLSDALAGEAVWRKRELSTLRFLVESGGTGKGEANVLLRAASTMLYAHWEGFVKSAGDMYISFVAEQRLALSSLASNFAALSTRSLLRRAAASSKIQQYLAVVDALMVNHGEEAAFADKSTETGSNLSSTVLREIFQTLGIDHSDFDAKANLIDEQLLRRRNTIAHGEHLVVDKNAYLVVHASVVEMIEHIKNLIDNAAAQKKYLR